MKLRLFSVFVVAAALFVFVVVNLAALHDRRAPVRAPTVRASRCRLLETGHPGFTGAVLGALADGIAVSTFRSVRPAGGIRDRRAA